MPAALPIVAPIAGAAVGGLFQGNENASNQNAANQAQQNAQNASQAAQQQSIANQNLNFQQALQRYQQYQKQNANPVYAQAPIQGPPQIGAQAQSVGGGSIGGPGSTPQGIGGTQGMNQQQLPEQKIPSQQLSAFIQLLQHAHGAAQKQGQIAAQSAPGGI